MFELITGIADLALAAPAAVPDWSSAMTVPDIKPDITSTFAQAAIRLAAIVLGVCFVLALLALGVALTIVGFKGFGNSQLLERAAGSVGWVIGALVGLGSLTGIAGWAIGFKIF